ncbi:MAG: SpoIIE family protein phosphatase [Thermoleophilia bacterium]|nr:SpoIIE family protein phosphatase [Thermoleophilia bacterium]
MGEHRPDARLLQLQRLSRALFDALRREDVAERFVREADGMLGAVRVTLALADGDDVPRLFGDPADPGAVLAATARVMGAGVPEWDPRRAAVPVVGVERTKGALVLEFGAPAEIGADDRLFLETLAEHAAQALHRARLHQEEAQARADAEERHAILRLALAATRTGFWQYDVASGTVSWSEEVGPVFGLPRGATPPAFEDALGMVHPEDRPHIAKAIETALAQKRPYEATYRVPQPDGSDRWTLTQGYPVLDAAGELTGINGLVRDVTEQKRAEAALRESATRTRRLMDGLFVFVGLLETDGTLVEANRTALSAADVRAEDVLGRPFWDTYWWSWHPEQQERLRRAVADAARGRASRYDAVVRLGEDTRITIDFQLVPILDDDGRVVNLVPSAIDITERERGRRRDALLAHAGAAMDAADTLEERAGALAGALVPEVGDYASVEITGADGRRTVSVAHADPDMAAVLHELRSEHALGARDPISVAAAQETRTPLLIPDVGALVREWPAGTRTRELLETLSPRSYLTTPIVLRGRPLGGILLGTTTRSGRVLDGVDLDLAGALAERAALALENARLHERDRHIARTLQHSLLPGELPHPEGLELASAYLAAGDGHEVGGDFYDVFRSGGDWVLVIGDVCGKGPEAAQLTSLCRHAIRVACLERPDADPVAILDLLNRSIIAFQPGSTRFSTAVVARVRTHPEGGAAVRVANGAHLPPVWLRDDGTVSPVPARGGLLGIDPAWTGTGWEGELAPGDALVLHTDGITEARRHGLFFGERRLMRVLRAAAGGDAGELVRAVERSVEEFQGGAPLLDDVAVLALRVDGAPRPAPNGCRPDADDRRMAVRVPVRYDALSGARASVRTWLQDVGVAPEVVDDLVIAVGEALANAVEHAAGDPGRPLDLECLLDDGDAVIRVRDHGTWRPPVATPNRGYGLRMIAALTHEASLASDGGTVLTMRHGLDAGAP